MATTNLDEHEKLECKLFLQTLINSSKKCSKDSQDEEFVTNEKYFESLCFCLTKEEIPGELIDVTNRYLHHKKCPDIFISTLIKFSVERFDGYDVSPFELERKDYEFKEYNAVALTKAFYKVFMEGCGKFLDNFDSMTIQKSSQQFDISLQAVRNRRRKMEDRHSYYTDLTTLFGMSEVETGQALFAVYDGHGGIDAANYVASQLLVHLKELSQLLVLQPGEALHKAIMKTDEEFIKKAKRENLRSGATAVVVLIQGMNLTVAWLGDSQVVLCKAGDAVQLMDPHRPNRPDERTRIESLGGCVVFFGGWRVNGSLAVSRSIGDRDQKPYITGEPDVEEYEMEGDEEFIILACDGLWDTVEPFDAVQLVRKCIQEDCRDTAAPKLVELAIEQRSMDNISILVVYFDFNKGEQATASSASSSSSSSTTADSTESESQAAEGNDTMLNGQEENLEKLSMRPISTDDSVGNGSNSDGKDIKESAVETDVQM